MKSSWTAWRQGVFALLALLACVLLPWPAMAQGNTAFNHDTTQFPLRGAHEIVRCETCHLNGVFKGTPKQCNLCHVQGSKTAALPMSNRHIPVTDQCDVCHNTSTFSGTQFTHAMVTPGSCETCHNNYYSQGKSANHPATTASCDVCHTVGAFLPVALFDHAASGIFAQPPSGPRCDSCHNTTRQPQIATGKSSNHVPVLNASADCSACHLQTTSWRPALFDHAANGISVPPGASQPSCASCHNGTYSLGKPAGTAHIPTTQDCVLCHNSSPVLNPGGFSVGVMNHLGITTNCAQCHAANTPYPPLNGKAVTNPNTISNHIPFGSASCETCHATAVTGGFQSWAGAVMNHSAVTSLSCQACHEDGANYAGLDSGTKLVMRSSLGTHIPVPASIGCSTCHASTAAFTSSVNFSTSGTHSTAATAQGCNACHADGAGPFAVSRSVVMPGATPSLSQQGLPHVALLSGTDCGSCHVASKIGNFAPGGNGFRLTYGPSTPSLTSAQHALVSGSCASCHQNAAFAGMVASTDTVAGDSFPSATLDKVHQTFTGDCGGCHSTSPLFANNAFAGARPTGHIPIGTNSCDVCHGSSGVYSTPDINATHSATATQYACTTCHNSTQSQAAKNIGGSSPNIVYVPNNHIPVGALGSTTAVAGTPTCDSAGCHQSYTVQTNFKTANGGGAVPANPSLTPDGHASLMNAGVTACTTCHESNVQTFLGMLKTVYVGNGSGSNVIADSRPPATDNNHPQSGDCGACHTTQATFAQHFSASAQPTGHIPVGTAECFACHTNTGSGVGNYSLASTHSAQSQPCLTCHNPTVSAGIQANAAALGFGGVPATPTVVIPSAHIPVGSLDCKQSGCHSAYNAAGGTSFVLGTASPTGTPTLNAAGHALVASTACATCHSAGTVFLGMDNSSSHVSDAFPGASVDAVHQNYSGGCDACHTTAPNFNTNVRTLPPKHLPVGSGATCTGCHTSVVASATGVAGGYAAADLTATHSATSTLACSSCHSATALQGALVAPTLTPKLSTAVNHIPFGSLDCAASGCHAKYTTGSTFSLGTPVYQIGSSLLSPAGHLSVAAGGVSGCAVCHNAAGATLYAGMLSSSTTPGDQAPSNAVDPIHFTQYTGECSQCHTTTATFGSNAFGKKPAGHIPTGSISACTTCHAGGVYNNPDMSASATHGTGQACAVCHNPTQSAAAASIGGVSYPTILYNGFNSQKHIPIGSLGNTGAANGVKTCDAAGCHDRNVFAAGGFVIGTPSINTPTLNVTGHSSVYLAGGTLATCTTCHEAGTGYQGMIATVSSATSVSVHGDTRPALSNHPQVSSGQDCGVCHSTAPQFANNFAAGSTVAEPAGHIPTAGANCSQCHGLDANQNFTGPNIVNVHTATSTQPCAVCHNQTVSQAISANLAVLSYNGVAPTPTVYADATHFPFGTVNCLSCHATYTSTTSTFKLGNPSPTGASLMSVSQHALVSTYSCVTCHSTGNGYKGLANDPTVVSDVMPASSLDPVHQNYTSSCDTCHTTAPNFNTNIKVLPPNHLPTGTGGNNCISCHTTVTASNGGSAYAVADLNVTHADTASLSCVSCHSASVVSVALVSAAQTPKLTTATNHIPIGSLDCKTSGCHDQPYSSKKTFVIGTPVYAPGSTLMSAATHALLPGAGVSGCAVCHTAAGTPPYAGMLSSATTAGDQAPSAAVDNTHFTQYTGECSQCHTTTPTFGANAVAGQPKGHIPTGTKSTCVSCHAGGVYTSPDLSAAGTHGTGLACAVCHNPTQSAAAAAIKATYVITYNGSGGAKHIPIGSLGLTTAASGVKTCDGAGCHSSVTVYSAGGFKMVPNSTPSFSAPTLSVTGHSTVAGAGQTSCTTCHEAGTGYQGMLATVSTATAITVHGDTRPALSNHPQASSGQDCGVCHSTAPNFANNFASGSTVAQPTGHIPSGGAACSACHGTDTNGNFTGGDITKTHTAATTSGQTCATCHNANVSAGIAGNAANLGYGGTAATPTVYNDGTHFPIGTVDCASSGCHKQYGPASSTTSTTFLLGAANPAVPTLAAAGHTSVSALTCTSCHGGTTTYKGMAATTAGSIGDMVPGTGVDPAGHKFTGDCGACHATTGLFNTNVTTLPPAHLPTGTAGTGNASCTTCHTAGDYVNMTSTQIAQTHTSTASLTCLSCHSATVTATALSTAALMPKLTTAVTHIPIGALDCAASGCHGTYTTSVTSFSLGAASINTPTLSVAGHTSAAGAGIACGTCHTNAAGGILYTGMVSSATTVGDQFPSASVDANHPAFQAACGPSCHTTTAPTFSSNNNGGALPTGHIPSTAWPAGAFPACSTCHIGGNNSVAQMSHVGLTGGCVTCHGTTQLSFLNVAPKAQPANHVPTNVAGMTNACEACHRNVQTGNFSSFAGTVMDHAGITTSCISCHAAGKAYYGVTMVNAPNGTTDGHRFVATLACETCHSNRQIPGGFANGKMVHSQVTATACTSCHETGSVFTGAVNKQGYPGGIWVRNMRPGDTGNGHSFPQNCKGCHGTSDAAMGSGTTAVAGAVLQPTSLVMSSTAIGTAVTKPVVLVNAGTAALKITSIAVSGTNATDFTQTNTCGTSLAAAASCVITVSFKPTAAGNRTATITLTDNANVTTGTATQTISLTGAVATTTLSASTAVALTSTGIKPATSPVQSLLFKNVGTTAVTVSSVTISGANASDFILTNGCTAALPATTGSCSIGIAFSPVANLGIQEVATLNITSNGFPSTYSLPLNGSIASAATAAAKRARVFASAPRQTGVNGGSLLGGLRGRLPGAPGTGTASASDTLAQVLALPGAPAGTGVPARAVAGGAAVQPGAPSGIRPLPGAGGPNGVRPVTGVPSAAAPASAAAALGAPTSIAAGLAAGTPGAVSSASTGSAAAAPAVVPQSTTAGPAGRPIAPAPLNGGPTGVRPVTGLPGSAAVVAPAAAATVAPAVPGAAQPAGLNPQASVRAASGVPFNHAGVIPGACGTCHNGRGASGLPKNHMMTNRSCDLCHNSNAWTPVTSYRHNSPKYQPHDASVTCISCHRGNTEMVVTPYPQYGTSCASCHANQFRPQQHRRADRPNQFFTAGDLQDCAGACHLALPGRMGSTPPMFAYHRSTAPAF